MAVNARDAMDGEGQLTISVGVVPELPAMRSHPPVRAPHVAVAISDSGSGIAADHPRQDLRAFLHDQGVGHGTGLGLSQVFGFAKQSEGDLAVESSVGAGTTFTLYLPVASSEEERVEQLRPESRKLDRSACVLVVEDNADVGEFAMQALASLAMDRIGRRTWTRRWPNWRRRPIASTSYSPTS